MHRFVMKYEKTSKYDQAFVRKNLMGPNAMLLLEEMASYLNFKPGMRILDLGCGTGLTSIFMAKEYGVHVTAFDLWITAEENKARFELMGLENLITPINGDAHALPFPNDYFDGVISVDSYQYYGTEDNFYLEKLHPILKKDAIVAISVPGMKVELGDTIPDEMKPHWDEDSFKAWKTIAWWKQEFNDRLNDLVIKELACFDQAWLDWDASDNPHNAGDLEMIQVDGGRYMNLLGIMGRVNK